MIKKIVEVPVSAQMFSNRKVAQTVMELAAYSHIEDCVKALGLSLRHDYKIVQIKKITLSAFVRTPNNLCRGFFDYSATASIELVFCWQPSDPI